MESAIQQSIPHRRRGLVVAKPEHLHVIHFAQSNVHRKFERDIQRLVMSERRITSRIWDKIEGMHIADESLLLVRHIRDGSVCRKKASCCGVPIRRVVGYQVVASEIYQSKMPPIAGMKFLPMKQQIRAGRSWVRLGAEVSDIRDTLLLVDNQILHNRQVLGCRSSDQALRRIAISSAIIHVDVQVCAYPAGGARN